MEKVVDVPVKPGEQPAHAMCIFDNRLYVLSENAVWVVEVPRDSIWKKLKEWIFP